MQVREYQELYIGRSELGAWFRFELASVFAAPCPGAVGYVLRKMLFPGLFRKCGQGAQFGRNLSVRHPSKIELGGNVAIDDNCLLDAGSVKAGEFVIGDRALIARGVSIVSKTDQGVITIGDDCTISRNCILTSVSGIHIGSSVGIGSQSFIGGSRGWSGNERNVGQTETNEESYTEGPVVLGDDCWIGTGARVLDGVTIGRGSIIGAGAVVREDVPAFTVVTPYQRLVMLPRTLKEPAESSEEATETKG